MEIAKQANGTEYVFEVKGKIDTDTAPELQASILETLENNPDMTNLTIDVAEVIYLSSAGLRAFLSIPGILLIFLTGLRNILSTLLPTL